MVESTASRGDARGSGIFFAFVLVWLENPPRPSHQKKRGATGVLLWALKKGETRLKWYMCR